MACTEEGLKSSAYQQFLPYIKAKCVQWPQHFLWDHKEQVNSTSRRQTAKPIKAFTGPPPQLLYSALPSSLSPPYFLFKKHDTFNIQSRNTLNVNSLCLPHCPSQNSLTWPIKTKSLHERKLLETKMNNTKDRIEMLKPDCSMKINKEELHPQPDGQKNPTLTPDFSIRLLIIEISIY